MKKTVAISLVFTVFFVLTLATCEGPLQGDYRTIHLNGFGEESGSEDLIVGGGGVFGDKTGGNPTEAENAIKGEVKGKLEDALSNNTDKLASGEDVEIDIEGENGAQYSITLRKDKHGTEVFDVDISGLDLAKETPLKGFIRGIQEGIPGKDIYLDLTECTGDYLQPILGKPKVEKNQFVSVTLPASVKYLQDFETSNSSVPTFDGFDNLKIIRAPGVTAINENAFKGLSSLVEVEFPMATTIGESAFKGCTSLKTLKFTPEKIREIGESAFEKCESLEKVNFPMLTKIPKWAFSKCKLLNELTFDPAKITEVGYYAFYGCESIEAVNFPKITRIETDTFSGCTKLAQLTFTNANIEYIGYNAFEGCKMSSVEFINTNLTEIENETFKDCTELLSVNIPNVQFIGQSAFEGCTKLTEVDFPQVADNYSTWNYKAIQDKAFKGCTLLATVNIPYVKEIGPNAFENCTSLEEVEFSYATKVGDYCFAGCTSLKKLELPALTVFNRSMFERTGTGTDGKGGGTAVTLDLHLGDTAPPFDTNPSFMFTDVNADKRVNIITTSAVGSAVYDGEWVGKFKYSNSKITVYVDGNLVS